jgi:hypothetical protein
MDYQSLIERARLIKSIESTATTGDVAYSGTALEITDENGEDLFHFVVDSKGDLQALFFSHAENYRMSMSDLEKIILKAKETVKVVD